MQLSEHFSLEELTASDTATRKGIDNTPNEDVLENLKITAQHLEQVRALLGCPIAITSGYRSPKLNTMIGGARNSEHCIGLAADIKAPAFGSPYDICIAIRDSGLFYNQLIHEYGTWCHVSFGEAMKRQQLSIFTAGNYLSGIVRL